jgi:hypothetical protein
MRGQSIESDGCQYLDSANAEENLYDFRVGFREGQISSVSPILVDQVS